VPRTSGGNCRVRSLTDWIIELVVYGGGGALLGFLLGLILPGPFALLWLGCILVGFVGGTLFGERGVNWIGQMLRSLWESDPG
jgi:hypothetical protein